MVMDGEISEFEKELERAARKLHDDFAALRTNRPTTKLVEDIKVDYYGAATPLKALGSISIVPPREITISVWDKNALQPIAKAIELSGIGLNPNIDGNIIRLNMPALTDERRQEIIKLAKKMAEETRIRVRMLRDEINKKIKSAAEQETIGENEQFKLKDKTQDIVDKTNQEIENLLINKTREINE